MKALTALTDKQQKNVPELRPGDTVRVHTKIIEGSKERIQVYEGVVLRVKGSGNGQTFTVRKLSYGVGVERTFLSQSPKIAKIEIKKRSTVRRAYLTYLRELRGKAAKLKDQRFDALAVNAVEELKAEDLAPASLEEAEDAELTELDAVEIADNELESGEVSIEEIAKAESKEADAEDTVTESEIEDDHQMLEEEEVAQGVEEAERDLEQGKDGEGAVVEKVSENAEPEKEEE